MVPGRDQRARLGEPAGANQDAHASHARVGTGEQQAARRGPSLFGALPSARRHEYGSELALEYDPIQANGAMIVRVARQNLLLPAARDALAPGVVGKPPLDDVGQVRIIAVERAVHAILEKLLKAASARRVGDEERP